MYVGENFLRVRRRISLTAASLDCFFVLGMLKLFSGSMGPAKCLVDEVTRLSNFP